MNGRFICIATTIIISVIACSPVYKFRHFDYQKKGWQGWAVINNSVTYVSFTADENGILPEDKDIAKARFERRKEFLEEYYKIKNPGTALTQLALLPVGAALFPVFIADEYREHVFSQKEQISEQERERLRRNQTERDNILQAYIVADMQKERETQLPQISQ